VADSPCRPHLPVQASLVRLLLSKGGDPNLLNDRLQSPLAGAIFKGEQAVVEVLVEGGADPDAGQPTARMSAEMFKNEVAQRLIRERDQRLANGATKSTE
jgi:ankyrin repeat protein